MLMLSSDWADVKLQFEKGVGTLPPGMDLCPLPQGDHSLLSHSCTHTHPNACVLRKNSLQALAISSGADEQISWI